MTSLAFTLKKVISAFLMPLPLSLILLLLGLLLLRKYKALGTLVTSIAILVLYLFSTEWLSNKMMYSLESKYEKYQGQDVSYIIVLGGGHTTEERRPISSLLHSHSLVRLVEGINIYTANPGSKLLLSGYGDRDAVSNAKTAQKVALSLGVKEEDITLAESVKDTNEEARHWSRFLASQDGDMNDGTINKVALVTSASHMPRSVDLFAHFLKEQQLDRSLLLPAPTNFVSSQAPLYWKSWIPNSFSLQKSRRAWHEILGLTWNKLTL